MKQSSISLFSKISLKSIKIEKIIIRIMAEDTQSLIKIERRQKILFYYYYYYIFYPNICIWGYVY